MTLTLFDDTHWLFVQPITPAPGTILDLSGTRLTATFTPQFGGSADPVATVASDASDGEGKVTFVPAAGAVGPYFLFDIPESARTWRASSPTPIFLDIRRVPDPSKPDDKFPIGRTSAVVHPGTASTGIASPSFVPVLFSAQPYGGLPLATPMLIGPQGRKGDPGHDGAAGGSLTLTAIRALSGHRAVRAVSSAVDYASSDDLSHAGAVIGVAVNAADADEPITIQQTGDIVGSSWTFVPGPVWLGLNGQLTQSIPTTGFVQQIGTALSSTRIAVAIGTPLLRSP